MFSVAERKYHTYKQKLCAMIKFTFKYYYLLQNLNQKAIIYTDHKSLIHFLKLSLHDEIYSHWAVKLRELYIKIMHIKEKRNTVTDDLFCIIFHWENCLADDTVQSIQNYLNCENFKWVWKNDKNSFNTFLKDLSELEKTEVIENESLHSLSVFVLESSVFWDTDYLCSEWFSQTYQYLYISNLSDDLSVSFLRKCLNYCLDKEIWLWITWRELHLLCVSETKIVTVLQKTHNYSDHWEKKNIILKLKRLVYWSSQSTDVKKYIQRCLSCVWHYSAQQFQLLHSIVTYHPFQLMIMNFIRPLQRSISVSQKYILHIMNYFSWYSVTYFSQIADASDIIKTLNDLFHHFSKSDIFYIDRDQHFENQLMKDYFKEQEIFLKFELSRASKVFRLIEHDNCILENVLQRTASLSRMWVETLIKTTQKVNIQIILHLHHFFTQILFSILPKSLLTRIVREDQLSEVNLLTWISSIENSNDHSWKIKKHLQQLITLQKNIKIFSEHEKFKMKK